MEKQWKLQEDTKHKLNQELERLENEKEQIQEPLKYAKELATWFKNFPPKKKKHIAAAIFNSIVIQNKEIIYFDLKPLFKGIHKREVLTHPEKTIQSQNESSNSKNKKKKPLLTSSSDNDLYGGGWGIRTLAAPCGTLQV